MKHGDTYIAKDGRKLVAIDSPSNCCHPPGFSVCEFGNEFAGRPCQEFGKKGPPCGGRPIIFVTGTNYLKFRLLGST